MNSLRIYTWLSPLLLLTAISCSQQKPSAHQPVSEADAPLINQTIGQKLGKTSFKIATPSDQRFKLSAGKPTYADGGLLVKLTGTAQLNKSVSLISLWEQTQGAQPAFLINDDQLETYVVLPEVTQKTHIEFALLAADEQNYVAQSTTAITVLPKEESPIKIDPVVINESSGILTFNVSLKPGKTLPGPIQYYTEQVTATADQDYTAIKGALTLTPQTPNASIEIPITIDEIPEGLEYFKLVITSPQPSFSRIAYGFIKEGVSLQSQNNPYVSSRYYLDADYQAMVAKAELKLADFKEAINIVKQQPTAIWLDTPTMLTQGDTRLGRRSLKAHLDLALSQQKAAAQNGTLSPMTVQVVLNQHPLAHPEANDLTTAYTPQRLTDYRQYINDLKTLAEAYPSLRLVVILEPSSLPPLFMSAALSNRVQHSSCTEPLVCQHSEDAQDLTKYAIDTLSSSRANNIYIYLGMGHSGWVTQNIDYLPRWLNDLQTIGDNGQKIKGFALNTGAYSPLSENLIQYPDHLEALTQFKYRDYLDEISLINGMQSALSYYSEYNDLGFIVDTSRNGWGDGARPIAMGGFASLLDTRINTANWCNIQNAGMGERFQVNPLPYQPYLHAFTWLKPPGTSDGNLDTVVAEQPMGHPCDAANGDALAEAPGGGFWFEDHFIRLMQNAWPPLVAKPIKTTKPFVELKFNATKIEAQPLAGVSIVGALATGTTVNKLTISVNGISQTLAENTIIQGNRFSIPVSALNIPYRSTTSLIDFTRANFRVTAEDAQGNLNAGDLVFNSEFYSSGTDINDLVQISNPNIAVSTWKGDDLVIAKSGIILNGFINTGPGQDTVFYGCGETHLGAGDDKAYLGGCFDARIYGDAGSDVFEFADHAGNNISIYEDATDTVSVDRLILRNIASTDPGLNVSLLNQRHLLIRKAGVNIVQIMDFYINGQVSHTLEEIEFSDGVKKIPQTLLEQVQ